MQYRIELRDKDFNILGFLENEATNIRWEYKRIGGCAGFSFTLPRAFNNLGWVSGDFNVRIYKRTAAGTFTLWYQGLIEDRSPILGDKENIQVRGYGYSTQLERILINETYSAQEISAIVTDILDNYIITDTDIAYSAGDIEATTFTVDSLEFKNVTAAEALKTLADLAGTREWGVDKDRNFFFKARSEVLNFNWWIGSNINNVNLADTFRDIVNRIVIEGGDVTGTKYTRTINRTVSQLKYNLRSIVIQNAAIVTNDVADQYAGAYLDEFDDVSRRATCEIINDETQIESTIPMGLASIRESGVRYGEQCYGLFLYSGIVKYQINKIIYSLDNNGMLKKNVDLGQLRPSTSEDLKQLEYQIEQLRAARV